MLPRVISVWSNSVDKQQDENIHLFTNEKFKNAYHH